MCKLDECHANCTACAGNTCTSAGQVCVDPDEEVDGDWLCECTPPAYGTPAVGSAAACLLDECKANCTTCARAVCASSNQTCVDKDPSVGASGDWECHCVAPASGSAVASRADCVFDECCANCTGHATCATAGQTCSDPDTGSAALGDFICACPPPSTSTEVAGPADCSTNATFAPVTGAPLTVAPQSNHTNNTFVPVSGEPPTAAPQSNHTYKTFVPVTGQPISRAPPGTFVPGVAPTATHAPPRDSAADEEGGSETDSLVILLVVMTTLCCCCLLLGLLWWWRRRRERMYGRIKLEEPPESDEYDFNMNDIELEHIVELQDASCPLMEVQFSSSASGLLASASQLPSSQRPLKSSATSLVPFSTSRHTSLDHSAQSLSVTAASAGTVEKKKRLRKNSRSEARAGTNGSMSLGPLVDTSPSSNPLQSPASAANLNNLRTGARREFSLLSRSTTHSPTGAPPPPARQGGRLTLKSRQDTLGSPSAPQSPSWSTTGDGLLIADAVEPTALASPGSPTAFRQGSDPPSPVAAASMFALKKKKTFVPLATYSGVHSMPSRGNLHHSPMRQPAAGPASPPSDPLQRAPSAADEVTELEAIMQPTESPMDLPWAEVDSQTASPQGGPLGGSTPPGPKRTATKRGKKLKPPLVNI
eukprot:TRINITY_DN3893_c1_g2_i1.p1 TRINITY_DN3893_c1_g2~~TRINITY_DN3893_c1_g2_i1.p1  ORF type:complete len:709 (+),score=106.71 TRINITY_DN3893_c1_g2_i1:181-2127(+)